VVVGDTAYEPLTYGQLPSHCLEPLLGDADLDRLSFSTFQILRNRFWELCLQLCEPRRIRVRVNSIPDVDKSLVDGFVQRDEYFQSNGNRPIWGYFVQGWWMNGGIKRNWTVLV
jgi:hypothetical protein